MDDQLQRAWRAWLGGDDAMLEAVMAARSRQGLSELPKFTLLNQILSEMRRYGYKKGRPTVQQAEAGIKAMLRARGWAPSERASRDAWLSPAVTRRWTFLRRNVVAERGSPGSWVRDYRVHEYGKELLTADLCLSIMKALHGQAGRDDWAKNAGSDPRANPRKRRANPNDKGGKKQPIAERESLAYAQGLENYDQALEDFRRFHGGEPGDVLVVRVDDGKPGVKKKVLVALGKVPESHYHVPVEWDSPNKNYAGDDHPDYDPREHGPIKYRHKHNKGSEPIEALDPETGLTMKIPTDARTRVEDWMYD